MTPTPDQIEAAARVDEAGDRYHPCTADVGLGALAQAAQGVSRRGDAAFATLPERSGVPDAAPSVAPIDAG